MKHIRYAVRTKAGWVGGKTFSYAAGTQNSETLGFEHARLFTRRHDAEKKCTEKGDRVVEVEVSYAG